MFIWSGCTLVGIEKIVATKTQGLGGGHNLRDMAHLFIPSPLPNRGSKNKFLWCQGRISSELGKKGLKEMQGKREIKLFGSSPGGNQNYFGLKIGYPNKKSK